MVSRHVRDNDGYILSFADELADITNAATALRGKLIDLEDAHSEWAKQERYGAPG